MDAVLGVDRHTERVGRIGLAVLVDRRGLAAAFFADDHLHAAETCGAVQMRTFEGRDGDHKLRRRLYLPKGLLDLEADHRCKRNEIAVGDLRNLVRAGFVFIDPVQQVGKIRRADSASLRQGILRHAVPLHVLLGGSNDFVFLDFFHKAFI